MKFITRVSSGFSLASAQPILALTDRSPLPGLPPEYLFGIRRDLSRHPQRPVVSRPDVKIDAPFAPLVALLARTIGPAGCRGGETLPVGQGRI